MSGDRALEHPIVAFAREMDAVILKWIEQLEPGAMALVLSCSLGSRLHDVAGDEAIEALHAYYAARAAETEALFRGLPS